MSRLSVLVHCERASQHGALVRAIEASGDAQVVAREHELERLGDAVECHRPDAIFVQLGPAAHATLDLLEKLPAPVPPIVVSGPADASALILRVMRLGAVEYLPTPLGEAEIRRAMGALSAEHRTRPEARPADAIAVVGAKGGVGTTWLASELARALAAHGRRTVLVDLDLGWGDAALHFDLSSRFSLVDAAQRDDLDEPYLETLLEPVNDELALLCAPTRPEDAERIRPVHLERALGLLRTRQDFLVLDVPTQLAELPLRGLELADQILLVTTAEVASLAQARRRIDLFARVGLDPARVRPILNRADRRDAMSAAELREFLGQPVAHTIANAYSAAQECITRGEGLACVAPRSRVASQMEELALRCHDWLHLRRPEPTREGGAFGRARSFLRNRLHGAD